MPIDDSDDYTLGEEQKRRALMFSGWINGGQDQVEYEVRAAIGKELRQYRFWLAISPDVLITHSTMNIEARMLSWLETGWVTNEELHYYLPYWIKALNRLGEILLPDEYEPLSLDTYRVRVPGGQPTYPIEETEKHPTQPGIDLSHLEFLKQERSYQEMHMQLGKNLRDQRVNLRFQRSALFDHCGIEEDFLSRFEKGIGTHDEFLENIVGWVEALNELGAELDPKAYLVRLSRPSNERDSTIGR